MGVNPGDISACLFANGLITVFENEEVNLQTITRQERMEKLLTAVQRAIMMNEQKFESFLESLGKEKKYSDLVLKMRGNFALLIIRYHRTLLYTIPIVCLCNFRHDLYHVALFIRARIACAIGSNSADHRMIHRFLYTMFA